MDEDEEMVAIPGQRFRFMHLVILTLDTVSSFVDDVNQLFMAHENWKMDRQRVENEMRADIEAIVGGA